MNEDQSQLWRLAEAIRGLSDEQVAECLARARKKIEARKLREKKVKKVTKPAGRLARRVAALEKTVIDLRVLVNQLAGRDPYDGLP